MIDKLKRFLEGNIFHFFETVSFFRPFCLLLFKTFRPSVVRILLRKPCFLARFLFLGWYVRFGMMLEYRKKEKISRSEAIFHNYFMSLTPQFFPFAFSSSQTRFTIIHRRLKERILRGLRKQFFHNNFACLTSVEKICNDKKRLQKRAAPLGLIYKLSLSLACKIDKSAN